MPQSTRATWSAMRLPQNVISGPTGTTANRQNAGAKASSGARLKRNRFREAPSGMKSSLKSILRTSARMCGMPLSGRSERPGMGRRARLGPTRSCMSALHLRSAMVSSVAVTMISTRMSATMLPTPSPTPPAMLGRSWKIALNSQTMKYSTQETTSSAPGPLGRQQAGQHDALLGDPFQRQLGQVGAATREELERGRRALHAVRIPEPGQDALRPEPARRRVAALRRHRRPHALQPAVPVHQRAVLLVHGHARKRHVRRARRLVLVLRGRDEELQPLRHRLGQAVGAHREHRLDALGRTLLDAHAERLGRELHAARVRVLVGADEELVLVASRLAAQEVALRAQLLAEQQRGGGLLHRALRGEVDADAALPGPRLQELDGAFDRKPQTDALRRLAATLAGPFDSVLVDRMMREPPLVAHPDLVHFLVAPRQLAVGDRPTRLDVHVAAIRAAGADAGRLVEEPDAALETEVAVEQRAHRADVHRVPGVLRVERLSREGGDERVRPALDDGELRLLGDLVHEAHAARAHDAALGVVDHQRPEDLALGLVDLVGADARGLVVVLHVVVLELALARLVADGAVHRVVDEVELHAAALVLLHRRRGGDDLQPFLHADLAARHQAAGRVARLHQAHAALPCYGQARVVAEVRDVHADAAGRLDQVVARVGLDGTAVDLDPHDLGRGVAHCSTSPPIMLMESKMGMMSATACPLMSRGSAERIGNPGARTWMVYGFPFPFETMWKPNSPLAPSQ